MNDEHTGDGRGRSGFRLGRDIHGPGREGRLGRRRLFGNEELRLLMLHLIAHEPRHGYELIRAIEELSGGVYSPSPGMIYPALTLLAEMEQITEQPGEGVRKRFAITKVGTDYIAQHVNECDMLLARLKALAEREGQRPDAAPVHRAMQNLKTALCNRLAKEGADEQTMLDVAALIDEAASKIERLK
jgi:DNA-binding PadR family transcriptional regulator